MSDEPKKRITLRDIAKKAGVSHPTVSRALHGSPSVSDKTKNKIRTIAESMGYAPDPMLSALAKYRNNFVEHSSTSRLALVVGPHLSDFLQSFSEAAKNYAQQFGYDFEHYIWDPETSDRRHSQILKSRGIRGIILAPLTTTADLERPKLNWKDFTVVTIGRIVETPHLDSISENHFGAVRLSLEKIYKAGYKRPGLITLDRINLRTADRLRSSFDAYMMTLPSEERVAPLLLDQGLSKESIAHWIEDQKVDAFLGHSWISERLRSYGWKIPEQFAFAALDLRDSYPTNNYAGASYNDMEIARLSVAILNDNITSGSLDIPNSPKTILLECAWKPGPTLPGIK